MSTRMKRPALQSVERLWMKHSKSLFCGMSQQQIPEISKNDGDWNESEKNDVFQTIAESQTYQDVTSDANKGFSYEGTSSMTMIAWNRENGDIWKVDDAVPLSGIINAKSIDAIRKELDRVKSQSITKQKPSSNKILDILDSLAESANITKNEDGDQTESEFQQHSDAAINSPPPELDSRMIHAYYKDEGQKLYDEATEVNGDATPRLLSALIFLKMHQDFSRNQLEKCFRLMDDLHEKTGHGESPAVYAELLKNANLLHMVNRGRQIVKKVFNSEDSSHLLTSKPLRQQIASFYSRTNLEKALEFISQLVRDHGRESVDAVIFAVVFSGMARRIQEGDKSMMEAAERLFEQMFKILNYAPDIPVFNSFLKCYSSIPDVESCIDVCRTMRSKHDWPNPSILTYGQVFQSIILHHSKPMEFDEGWNYIETVLEMMNEDGIKNEASTYGMLFSLCGGLAFGKSDLQRLYQFYDEMMAQNVKLTPRSGNSLLMAGVDHYAFEIQKDPQERQRIMQELKQYIDWVLLQFQANNLKLSKDQRTKLERRLRSM